MSESKDIVSSLEGVYSQIVETLKYDLGTVEIFDSVSIEENFKDTPKRATLAFFEMVQPPKKVFNSLKEILSVTFPFKGNCSEVVKVEGIEVPSLCPHHFLPVLYTVSVEYLPFDSVLGLSKLVRAAQTLARIPLLQEDYTRILAELVKDATHAKRVKVEVEGLHTCMVARGAEHPSARAKTSIEV